MYIFLGQFCVVAKKPREWVQYIFLWLLLYMYMFNIFHQDFHLTWHLEFRMEIEHCILHAFYGNAFHGFVLLYPKISSNLVSSVFMLHRIGMIFLTCYRSIVCLGLWNQCKSPSFPTHGSWQFELSSIQVKHERK